MHIPFSFSSFLFPLTKHASLPFLPINIGRGFLIHGFFVRYIFLVFFLLGTRWISHKLAALQLLVDKFGVYLQHLQSRPEDKSFKSADRQKFKGWLKKWQQARIPLTASLFIELLSPAKALSLAFQEDEIDIVATISHIETAKQQLERLE